LPYPLPELARVARQFMNALLDARDDTRTAGNQRLLDVPSVLRPTREQLQENQIRQRHDR
jgi:hypothetical protein